MPQMTLAPVGLSRRKPPNYAYDTYAPKRPPKPKDQSPKPKSQLPIKNWARRRVANYSGWWLETEDIDTDAVCLKHSINGIVSDWLMRDLKKAQMHTHPPRTHAHTHTCRARWHTIKHVIIIMPKGVLFVASQDIVSHTAAAEAAGGARRSGIRGVVKWIVGRIEWDIPILLQWSIRYGDSLCAHNWA